MDAIPIVRVGDVLLVTIQVDLEDAGVAVLQRALLTEIDQHGAGGVIIDISGVDVLDTFTARSLVNTARMTALMGATMIVCGMRPAVAITLTEMGFVRGDFMTTLNVNAALRALASG